MSLSKVGAGDTAHDGAALSANQRASARIGAGRRSGCDSSMYPQQSRELTYLYEGVSLAGLKCINAYPEATHRALPRGLRSV